MIEKRSKRSEKKADKRATYGSARGWKLVVLGQPFLPSNDEVERRGASLPQNETGLSESSILS
jgi:hypothetical protein